MKILFASLYLIFLNVAYSQKYKPLVEEKKYWIYNHYFTSGCFMGWQIATEIRYFQGDTIIDSKQYKKLVSSFVPIDKFPLEISSKKTLCFMREDTVERKVYIINNDESVFPCADGMEVCIWDFSLNVGDTIKNCTYDIFYPVDVPEYEHNIIDTIIIGDIGWGFEQKHFYTKDFAPGQCNDPWIYEVSYAEGFGMENGPILKIFGTYLSKYCEGTLEKCNIINSTKDDPFNIKNKISIFPNPSLDFIKIESTLDIISTEIIDQNRKTMLTPHQREVDVSQLSNGLYITRCTTLQKEWHYNKFVKL